MNLYVLMAQRKERYGGQYGMEALAVMSEAGQDENPDYLRDAMEENKASGEFDALAVVQLKVSGEAIRAILYPNAEPVKAAVVGAAQRRGEP
jgi:hypothetical protein